MLPTGGAAYLRNAGWTGRAPGEPDLGVASARAALAEIAEWPGYGPTPLVDLPGVAAAAGLSRVLYKDEGPRFGVGSFKPMGGGYAVARVLARAVGDALGLPPMPSSELLRGAGAGVVAGATVACATDGNHGRAVAWAAGTFGCRAVVFVASHVSEYRASAIADLGASVVRSAGNHDEAVREMAAAALGEGWHVVTQAASATDPRIPRDILTGYGAIMAEVDAQVPAGERPTHVFVPAGAGGLAASVVAYAASRWGADGPRVVTVEPHAADCVARSLAAGRPVTVTGAMETLMGGLAAGEVSPCAWPFLREGVFAAAAIPDAAAAATVRLLDAAPWGDPRIRAGETGAAALAGALLAAGDREARAALGMDRGASVLAIGTEGVTDPFVFADLTGRPPPPDRGGGSS